MSNNSNNTIVVGTVLSHTLVQGKNEGAVDRFEVREVLGVREGVALVRVVKQRTLKGQDKPQKEVHLLEAWSVEAFQASKSKHTITLGSMGERSLDGFLGFIPSECVLRKGFDALVAAKPKKAPRTSALRQENADLKAQMAQMQAQMAQLMASLGQQAPAPQNGAHEAPAGFRANQ